MTELKLLPVSASCVMGCAEALLPTRLTDSVSGRAVADAEGASRVNPAAALVVPADALVALGVSVSTNPVLLNATP